MMAQVPSSARLSTHFCLRDESRAQEETDSLAEDSVQRDVATAYRLFGPLTYNRATTKKFLSVDGDTTSLMDRTLMKAYLKHPEEVSVPKKEKTDIAKEEVGIVPVKISMVKKVKEIDPDELPNHPLYQDNEDAINLVYTRPNFWTFSGDYNLQFMQTYISPNWYNSGNSNYSMLGTVTLQYNYNNKQRVKWDNKLEMRLGFLTTEADTINKFKATDDLLRYTTQLSFQAHKQWYYATQVIASTQFTKGLKDNDRTVYSDFMSPLNLNVSLGMNYVVNAFHKKLTGNVMLSPLSYKLIYCDRSDIVTRFGIEAGKHALNDIGALVNVDVMWKPLDNFKWQSRLYAYYAYTNSLSYNPRMFQVEWENTLTFQFNRFISAKLYIYPRFDNTAAKVDNTLWQLKENLSVGFSYTM